MQQLELQDVKPQQPSFFKQLDEQQQIAVSAAPTGATIVHAGPGSGKTRVVTYRIAYLMEQFKFKAQNIVAVTFTNKAAEEMKNRVASIFSENDAKLLSIGTFHNLAAKILRTCISKWNNKMQGNFTILDRSDQEKIVLDICKQSDMEMTMKRNNSPLIREVLNFISKAKNEEKIPADFEKIDTQRKPNRWSKIGEDKTLMLANIYAQYESYKQDGNLVDFDDLLLGAVQLFKKNTAVRNIYAERCRALCIDEFQDISPLQLQFCQLLTSTHGHIFVVGDQDQLIYAWRFATTENLKSLRRNFPICTEIVLNINYRSSKNIVRSAQVVIDEAEGRVQKEFVTMNPVAAPVFIGEAGSTWEEGDMIASGIKYLLAETNGTVNLRDIAVLARTNEIVQRIGATFDVHGIKHKIIGTIDFFKRKEIKDLLAYLQLAENSYNTMALERVINVPARRIGKQILVKLKEAAKREDLTVMEIVEKVCAGYKVEGVRGKKGLMEFGRIIHELEKMAKGNSPLGTMLRFVIDQTKFKEYLEKSDQNWKVRWENVEQLLKICERFSARNTGKEKAESSLLELFLQNFTLHAGELTLNEENADTQDLVTISTIHSAKGLEFGVVFIASVEEEVLPSKFSKTTAQIEEERRVLFVGMTRARAILCLSHSTTSDLPTVLGQHRYSRFLSPLLCEQPPQSRITQSQQHNSSVHITKSFSRIPIDLTALAKLIGVNKKFSPNEKCSQQSSDNAEFSQQPSDNEKYSQQPSDIVKYSQQSSDNEELSQQPSTTVQQQASSSPVTPKRRFDQLKLSSSPYEVIEVPSDSDDDFVEIILTSQIESPPKKLKQDISIKQQQ